MHAMKHLTAYEFHVEKQQHTPDLSVHILLYNRALKPMLLDYLRREGLCLGEMLLSDHYIRYEVRCRVEHASAIYRLESLLREQAHRLRA